MLLVIVMVIGLLPTAVFADTPAVTEEIHWAAVKGQNTGIITLYLGNSEHVLQEGETVLLNNNDAPYQGITAMVFNAAYDTKRPFPSSVISRVFIESKIVPQSCRYVFCWILSCTSFEGLELLDTSQVTSMQRILQTHFVGVYR